MEPFHKSEDQIIFEANEALSSYLFNEKHLYEFENKKKDITHHFWVFPNSSILFEAGKIILKTSNKILFSDYKILKNEIDAFISENEKPLDLSDYLQNKKNEGNQ